MVLHAWIKHCSLKIASLDVLGTQISCASQHHATSVDNPQAFKCGPRICFRRASEILLQILHNQTAQPAQAPITVLAALSTCMYTEPPWRWLRLLEPLGPMHASNARAFQLRWSNKICMWINAQVAPDHKAGFRMQCKNQSQIACMMSQAEQQCWIDQNIVICLLQKILREQNNASQGNETKFGTVPAFPHFNTQKDSKCDFVRACEILTRDWSFDRSGSHLPCYDEQTRCIPKFKEVCVQTISLKL